MLLCGSMFPSPVLKWSYTTGLTVFSSPAIGTDSTVFFGSLDYKVYALDGATGSLKWSFSANNTVQSSPTIGSDGTVIIGSQDNKLYALDVMALYSLGVGTRKCMRREWCSQMELYHWQLRVIISSYRK